MGVGVGRATGVLAGVAAGVAAVGSVVFVAGPAQAADIHDCEFGTEQVFDVQWSSDGTTLSVSGMDFPYSDFGLFAPTPPATRFDASTLAAGDYFMFFDSVTVPGTLGLAVYDSSGAQRGVIDETGSFEAIGDDFIFYNGSGRWGTLFTTQEGFSYGDGADFPITNPAPTTADVLAYTNCRTAPVSLPVIGPGAPPDGVVGQAFPPFTIPVLDPAPGFTYAVTAGALPPGLALDPDSGVISGTPTEAGSSTFTITVVGGTGTATADYTIAVAAPAPAPPVTPTATAAATGAPAAELASSGSDSPPPWVAVVAVALATGGVLLARRGRRGASRR